MPCAGIFKYDGWWYVWPPVWWERDEPEDFEPKLLEYMDTHAPYPSRHAAAIACIMLYGN